MSGSATEYTCHMPQPGTPMVDPATGVMSVAWWNWALKIFGRTGAQVGVGTSDVASTASAAGVAAAAAQTTANAAQTSANTANAAVATEAAARVAGDNTNAVAITTERTARLAADAVLLPLSGARQMTGPLRLAVFTVGTLPAGAQGMTALVTDALAPAFGVAVGAGGAVVVPVYHDGAAWMVG